MPRMMSRSAACALASAVVSACSSTPYVPPAAPLWSVDAVATLEPGGAYTVHTVTLAPQDCYMAVGAEASRSPLPETIELRITLARSDGDCDGRATNVAHDFEAAGAGPDDSQVEVVVLADGREMNRAIVPLSPPRALDRI